MKVTYGYLHIEILAEEDLINGPDELQLSDDVSTFEEDVEGWLSWVTDEYPDLTFKLSIG